MRYPPKSTREVEMLTAWGQRRRKTNSSNEVKDVRFYDKVGNRRNQFLTQTTKGGEEENRK